MSDKLKMFDWDDPATGEKVKVKTKAGSNKIEVKIGSAQWKDVDPQTTSPPDPPNIDQAVLNVIDYGFFKGSRWVYINGKWYYI